MSLQAQIAFRAGFALAGLKPEHLPDLC